ncbi:tetratricopeptide repeat protein [Haloferula sp. A504]|uniref:tetratricopeptide repeat protein n=1 Tax=Haloferula sp. A504 TaxID=3373601 RepID=UPI0031C4FB35|nr:tetratricopeptide repeat protein [Verrucomicrobiaceae bacterium E54]
MSLHGPSGILASIAFAATFWFTADQQGQRSFEREDFTEAAEHFNDPMWKGVALYRDGEFKQAQAVFARLDTAEAHYNRGNCLVFLGKYQDAVASYDRALTRRPGWIEAGENRAIAEARGEATKNEGGDMGDQKLGADKIVFDKKKPGGQETQVTGEQSADPASMQALWLRRVQTRPADFLRAKFAYQNQFGEGVEE